MASTGNSGAISHAAASVSDHDDDYDDYDDYDDFDDDDDIYDDNAITRNFLQTKPAAVSVGFRVRQHAITPNSCRKCMIWGSNVLFSILL